MAFVEAFILVTAMFFMAYVIIKARDISNSIGEQHGDDID